MYKKISYLYTTDSWNFSLSKRNTFWNVDNSWKIFKCIFLLLPWHGTDLVRSFRLSGSMINQSSRAQRREKKTWSYTWGLGSLCRKLQGALRTIWKRNREWAIICIPWHMPNEALHEIKSWKMWDQVVGNFTYEDIIIVQHASINRKPSRKCTRQKKYDTL